jgi:hypothetical protein
MSIANAKARSETSIFRRRHRALAISEHAWHQFTRKRDNITHPFPRKIDSRWNGKSQSVSLKAAVARLGARTTVEKGRADSHVKTLATPLRMSLLLRKRKFEYMTASRTNRKTLLQGGEMLFESLRCRKIGRDLPLQNARGVTGNKSAAKRHDVPLV